MKIKDEETTITFDSLPTKIYHESQKILVDLEGVTHYEMARLNDGRAQALAACEFEI